MSHMHNENANKKLSCAVAAVALTSGQQNITCSASWVKYPCT